jgi:hypothetical protein
MDQPKHVLVFALGCIGSLAPEVARLYKLRNKPMMKFSLFYIVISLFYASFGGVIALVLPAVTIWAAFYAGVTWPMLLSMATKHHERYTVLANDDPKNIIKAKEVDIPNVSKFKEFIELFRDHADGLFE